MSIEESKAALRAEMRSMRRALPLGGLYDSAGQLCEQLERLDFVQRAECIAGYCATAREADPSILLQARLRDGRLVALPRVEGDRLVLRAVRDLAHLTPGYRGILEPDPERCPPLPPDEAGVVLIPGLAFDRAGGRLGQGGGHYDRLLAELPARAIRVALAHPFQIVPTVPTSEHDQRVDWVVTPHEAIRVGSWLDRAS